MFTTFRGGSRSGNFQPRVDATFVPYSQMLQSTNPILLSFYFFDTPNEVSTGPNVVPLSLQILHLLKMLYSEGRSGFSWTEPVTERYFHKLRTRKGKQLRRDIWFSKSTFRIIYINIKKEGIRVGIKS